MLKKRGYGVTNVEGEGTKGPVKLIFAVVKRNKVNDMIELIKQFNPNAFYTVEDIRYVQDKYSYTLNNSNNALKTARALFQKRK